MTLVLRGVAVMVSAITASRRASSEQPLGQSACAGSHFYRRLASSVTRRTSGGVATEAMMDPAAQKSNRVRAGLSPASSVQDGRGNRRRTMHKAPILERHVELPSFRRIQIWARPDAKDALCRRMGQASTNQLSQTGTRAADLVSYLRPGLICRADV